MTFDMESPASSERCSSISPHSVLSRSALCRVEARRRNRRRCNPPHAFLCSGGMPVVTPSSMGHHGPTLRLTDDNNHVKTRGLPPPYLCDRPSRRPTAVVTFNSSSHRCEEFRSLCRVSSRYWL